MLEFSNVKKYILSLGHTYIQTAIINPPKKPDDDDDDKNDDDKGDDDNE